MEKAIINRMNSVMTKLSMLASDVPRKNISEIYEINFYDTNNGNKNIISYWNIPQFEWNKIKFTSDELNILLKLGWRIWIS